MIRPPRYIDVLPKDIDPKEEYQGYRKGKHTYSLCTITFDENLNPIIFNKYPLENEEKEAITAYMRYMTWQEEENWYKNAVDLSNEVHKINLMGLHNDLYSIGDGCHEMWNGWIGTDWKEQLMNLIDENFFIVGIAPCGGPIRSFRDPVAVVCEMRGTGERFWCHAEKDWIDYMREDSKIYYEAIMKEG